MKSSRVNFTEIYVRCIFDTIKTDEDVRSTFGPLLTRFYETILISVVVLSNVYLLPIQ